MLPWETLRRRDIRRARRRTDRIALEQLEGRQLLSYSSLGYSLARPANQRLSRIGGLVGKHRSVSALLQNMAQARSSSPTLRPPPARSRSARTGNPVPGFAVPSSASAPESVISVILAHRPRSLAGAIQIGSITAPALEQNNIEQVVASITLPQRPAGFPASGVFYIRLQANATNTVLQSNHANNLSAPIPVRFISQVLPSCGPPRWTCPP